eukprot:TRINITY_DN2629_c0_g1_i2.p1 TRINITY_DN2629_c0_g1~~TRINITY_DN2629_c0_g1_i2.p1  ORF type:complete len:307 (-),score=59.28 TRINITY_DN2629_c0_g1_i2:396-1316(-)
MICSTIYNASFVFHPYSFSFRKMTNLSRLSSFRNSLVRLRGVLFSSKAPRQLSTSSTDADNKGSATQEAETVYESQPQRDNLLVLGGNGFVGSHVCKEGLRRSIHVLSLSRSGKPAVKEPWVNNVEWHQGNLLDPESLRNVFTGISSVISCVGGFGSNEAMYRINGTANIHAIQAASQAGVKRFVFISAADFGIARYLLRGYYEGKRAAEKELESKFRYGGVILRPGFIYGTRQVGSFKLPLELVGSPLEMVLRNAKSATQIPLLGPLFTPPVKVTSVAKVSVRAATDDAFPPGVLDVWGILRLGN